MNAERPSLLARLRERKVVQWSVAYGAVGLAVGGALDWLQEPWGLSLGFVRAVHVLLAAGLVVAIVLAWYHGEQGRQSVHRSEAAILTVVLAVGIALAVWAAGAVSADEGAAPAVDRQAGAVAADERPSVAALPFTSVRSDEESAAFAAGIHDDLLLQLGRLSGVRSVSRTSVERFRETEEPVPEIAAALGVDAVLQGLVQRADDQVRFNVSLLDGATDTSLWADQFSVRWTVENYFEAQARIVSSVVAALEATLLPEERAAAAATPTASAAAYQAFLEGKSHELRNLRVDEARAAVASYERAVALDPDFGLAWARLASAASFLAFYHEDDASDADRVADALQEARSLAPDLAETFEAAGWIAYHRDRDYARAAQQFAAAIDRDERAEFLFALAAAQKRLGRFEEGLRSLYRTVELDPLRGQAWNEVAYHALGLGRYEEAARSIARTRALNPAPGGGILNDSLKLVFLAGDTAAARRYDIVHEDAAVWRGLVSAYLDGDFLRVAELGEQEPAYLGIILPFSVGMNALGTAMLRAKAGDQVGSASRLETLQSSMRDRLAVLEGDDLRSVERARMRFQLAVANLIASPSSDVVAGVGRRLSEYRGVDRFAYGASKAELVAAAAFSLIGDVDGALRHLETCLTEVKETCSAAWLRVDPWWDHLRAEPRFVALLARFEGG